MSPLTESELSAVAGQGNSSLLYQIGVVAGMAENPGSDESSGQLKPDVIEGMKLTANVFVPVLNLLDSDLSISGVHYREGEPRYVVGEDGAITMAFRSALKRFVWIISGSAVAAVLLWVTLALRTSASTLIPE